MTSDEKDAIVPACYVVVGCSVVSGLLVSAFDAYLFGLLDSRVPVDVWTYWLGLLAGVLLLSALVYSERRNVCGLVKDMLGDRTSCAMGVLGGVLCALGYGVLMWRPLDGYAVIVASRVLARDVAMCAMVFVNCSVGGCAFTHVLRRRRGETGEKAPKTGEEAPVNDEE